MADTPTDINTITDWAQKILADSDLVHDSKDLINALNQFIPVLGEYALKFNTTELTATSDWKALNDNSVYVFSAKGVNAPDLGTNTKGIILVVGEKGDETQLVLTPAAVFYKVLGGSWQKLVTSSDLATMQSTFVKVTDTLNWQKQAIFNKGDYKLVTCPKGTDIYEFLKSASVPVGFSIVRDDTTSWNIYIIKESSKWVYGFSVASKGIINTITIYNGVGNKHYIPHSGDLTDRLPQDYDTNAFRQFITTASNLDLNDWLKQRTTENAQKGISYFKVEADVPNNPLKEDATGLIIWGSSTYKVSKVILIGEDGESALGVATGTNVTWSKKISTKDLDDYQDIHGLNKADGSYQLVIKGGAGDTTDVAKAIQDEINKGHGSFTIYINAGATLVNSPNNTQPFSGTVVCDSTKKQGTVTLTNLITGLSYSGTVYEGVLLGGTEDPYLETSNTGWHLNSSFMGIYGLRNDGQVPDEVTTDLNDFTTPGTYLVYNAKNDPSGIGVFNNEQKLVPYYLRVEGWNDPQEMTKDVTNSNYYSFSTHLMQTVTLHRSGLVDTGQDSDSNILRIPNTQAYRTYDSEHGWSSWNWLGHPETGWTPIMTSNYRMWQGRGSDTSTLGYCKYLSGVLTVDIYATNAVDIAYSIDNMVMGRLPSGFRIGRDLRFVMQGSSVNRWLMTVGKDGTIGFSRYGSGSGNDMKAGAWLVGSATMAM